MPAPDLILLHGALGTSAQFETLLPLLDGTFRVHRLDFEGHGTTPARSRVFRMEHFVENVVEYMQAHGVQRARFFGYSMGGYVALLLARRHPEFVENIVTLGTKFRWNAEIAMRETAMLDPVTIRAKVPKFADMLAVQHTAMGWESLLDATAEMMHLLGANAPLTAANVTNIAHPVRICVGDRDLTVDIDESLEMARGLPNGELEVWPRTPHPWQKVEMARVVRAIADLTPAP